MTKENPGASAGRPTWDQWGLALATGAATRGDCSRRQVGCVILRPDRRKITVGYNGTKPGEPGCLDGACPRARSDVAPGSSYDPTGPGACIALHAEQNAVATGDYDDMVGGTAYITEEPCYMCRTVLTAAGVVRAVWPAGEVTL